jgi:hypothetical protein
MRSIALAVTAALFAFSSLQAGAQSSDQRFTLEKSGDGYVRMDNRTGQLSKCMEESGQLVCKLAADDRQAFEDELGRLQDRVGQLEKRVSEMETVRRLNPEALLPTDEDVEKSLTYMERFFRRFMDIVRDFDKDLRKDEPQATPEKT